MQSSSSSLPLCPMPAAATAADPSKSVGVSLPTPPAGESMPSAATGAMAPRNESTAATPTAEEVANRLTFKSDPSLLQPPVKERKLSRCETEKLRRDRMNAYIGELAKIVPLVMQTSKKIDKASVLRLTVTYLRIYHDLIVSPRVKNNGNGPSKALMRDLSRLLLDTFDGFLLVVNAKGVIIFVSEAITKHLGHNMADILGFPLFNFLHPDDHQLLRNQLELLPSDQLVEDIGDRGVRGHRSFSVRIQRASEQQVTEYSVVHLVGHLRQMPISTDGVPPAAASECTDRVNRRRGVCLIAIGRLEEHRPITELYPILNDSPKQWITRHELDGKITYSDQRGACLTGFMPGESVGMSAYSLVHPEDIPYITALHNYFLVTGTLPQTMFRMFTKSRDILYVSNTTYLVLDMWTKQAKFIISVNEVMSDEEGKTQLQVHHDTVRALTANIAHIPATANADDSKPCSGKASSITNGTVAIVPDIVEVDNSTVSVTVGDQQFVVDISPGRDFDSRHRNADGSRQSNIGSNVVFDPHASEEDGGRNIPLVQPTFLGDDYIGGDNKGSSSSTSTSIGDGNRLPCFDKPELFSEDYAGSAATDCYGLSEDVSLGNKFASGASDACQKKWKSSSNCSAVDDNCTITRPPRVLDETSDDLWADHCRMREKLERKWPVLFSEGVPTSPCITETSRRDTVDAVGRPGNADNIWNTNDTMFAPRDDFNRQSSDNWLANDFGNVSFNGNHATSSRYFGCRLVENALIGAYQHNAFSVGALHSSPKGACRASSAAACWKGSDESWTYPNFHAMHGADMSKSSHSQVWSVNDKTSELYSDVKGSTSTGHQQWSLHHCFGTDEALDAGGYPSNTLSSVCAVNRRHAPASAGSSKAADVGSCASAVDCTGNTFTQGESLSFPILSPSSFDVSSYDIDPDDKTIFDALKI